MNSHQSHDSITCWWEFLWWRFPAWPPTSLQQPSPRSTRRRSRWRSCSPRRWTASIVIMMILIILSWQSKQLVTLALLGIPEPLCSSACPGDSGTFSVHLKVCFLQLVQFFLPFILVSKNQLNVPPVGSVEAAVVDGETVVLFPGLTRASLIA